MTLVTNRDSEDSRPRECWRPLVGMSTVILMMRMQEYVVLCCSTSLIALAHNVEQMLAVPKDPEYRGSEVPVHHMRCTGIAHAVDAPRSNALLVMQTNDTSNMPAHVVSRGAGHEELCHGS